MDYNIVTNEYGTPNLTTTLDIPTYGSLYLSMNIEHRLHLTADFTLKLDGMMVKLHSAYMFPHTGSNGWLPGAGIRIEGADGGKLSGKKVNLLLQQIITTVNTWLETHPEVFTYWKIRNAEAFLKSAPEVVEKLLKERRTNYHHMAKLATEVEAARNILGQAGHPLPPRPRFPLQVNEPDYLDSDLRK